jgi:hypothetical protein
VGHAVRADHEVDRQQDGGAEPGRDADRVQDEPAPRLDHAGQADQAEPEPEPYRMALPEPGPDRHEQRRGELEQQPDADRHPADRHQEQQGYQKEAGQPVAGQDEQVPPADPDPAPAADRQQEQQHREGAGGPQRRQVRR